MKVLGTLFRVPFFFAMASRSTLFGVAFPARTGREAILQTALEIIVNQGWDAFSMRELGRKLGVRASSLYNHFTDRKAIEEALAIHASNRLLLAMKAASNGLCSDARIHALALSYLDFASQNQALYQLIAVKYSRDCVNGEQGTLWQLLVEAMGGQNMDEAIAFWSLLHGYASLEAAGMFGASGGRSGLERSLSALLSGLARKQNII